MWYRISVFLPFSSLELLLTLDLPADYSEVAR
jgi:hypothetical protein